MDLLNDALRPYSVKMLRWLRSASTPSPEDRSEGLKHGSGYAHRVGLYQKGEVRTFGLALCEHVCDGFVRCAPSEKIVQKA
ncbi:hypothetical protein [Halalkalibacter alkalisediminis]|uniref:Uncharacterized protein n=1 Tax=Halalkalibacter alkalisediminis TaxID=935616 RepID=A0ABV6NMZ8_9BACI|nr:hypothetical protein [Halalkalibacter alkalisediminis]